MTQQANNDRVDELVGKVVEEYLQCCERGEQPPLDELVARHSEVGDILQTVIPALHAAEHMTGVFGDVASAPGRQLGDFRILRRIGRGGMGVVYEAEQISMQRRVALKVLPLAGLVDEVRIQRFQNEVRAAAALEHPNIVSIYMVGEVRGVHYYAMQLIRGRSLSEVISSLGRVNDEGVGLDGTSISQVASRGHLADEASTGGEASTEFATHDSRQSENPEAVETVARAGDSTIPHSSRREYFCSVAALGIQAASALQHAHDHGVIHRDIKPANLLLDGATKLHLADFGLARIEADAGVTMTGDLIGTLRYMAPEQALAKRVVVDHRADIYSLGATLYELLALRPAYTAKDRQQLLKQIAFEDPTSLRRVDRSIPIELATIVQKAMAKDMANRYTSAQELADDLGSYLQNRPIKAKPPTLLEVVGKWSRRNPILTVATAVVAITVAVSLFLVVRERVRFASLDESTKAVEGALANERWARTEALPEIRRLVDEEKYSEALTRALTLETQIPGDPDLEKLWPEFSIETSITSEPTGVDVSIREWNSAEGQWRHIGQTPIDRVRLPKGRFHWKLTRIDHATLVLLRGAASEIKFRLEKSDRLPPGMVRVTGGGTFVFLGLISHVPRFPVGDFLIDRYEVTNRQFQQFVDLGGYASRKYWKHRFVKDGSTAPWEEAMAQFVDSTGNHGPAGWKSGHFPAGQQDYPVRGVSWYEAAAYAEFAGKRLPSVYHWSRAADLWEAPRIIPVSNFGTDSPAVAGHYLGVGGSGAFDMAGNVKEWCWNEAGDGKRYILGGAWNEPKYMFNYPDWQPSFDRSETFGFRCVKPLSVGETSTKIDDEIIPHRLDFSKKKPASDQEFAFYKRLFSYDKGPLNANTRLMRESERYSYEKIQFDAAYGNERMTAHFYRPSRVSPPYQTVLYFPPAHTQYQDFDETVLSWQIAFLVENGRAVLYPVYKGSFERKDPSLSTSTPTETNQYKDYMIAWSKDLARSIDYLETRPDVEHQKLGYYGYSWGASIGPVLLALEDRIKVAVLSGAGLWEQATFPEVSQITYASRVTIPVLMLNGRYNTFYPVERSVEPLHRMLGTHDDDKLLLTFESGQFIPQKDLTKEAIGWLDKYLGPVYFK